MAISIEHPQHSLKSLYPTCRLYMYLYNLRWIWEVILSVTQKSIMMRRRWRWKNFYDTFSRFDTLPDHDEQTVIATNEAQSSLTTSAMLELRSHCYTVNTATSVCLLNTACTHTELEVLRSYRPAPRDVTWPCFKLDRTAANWANNMLLVVFKGHNCSSDRDVVHSQRIYLIHRSFKISW